MKLSKNPDKTKKKRISIDELIALPEEEQDKIVEEQLSRVEMLDSIIEDNADILEN